MPTNVELDAIIDEEEREMLQDWRDKVAEMSHADLVQAFCNCKGKYKAIARRQMKKEGII
jgi:hypothetical protein